MKATTLIKPAKRFRRMISERKTVGSQIAGYHQKICDLELEISHLRRQIDQLDRRAPSLENYSELFRDAPVGYLILDPIGFIQDTNAQLRLMLGYAADKPLEGPFIRYVLKEKSQEFLDHLHQVRRASRPMRADVVLRTITGKPISVEMISVAMINPEGPQRICAVIVDIAHRRLVQEALYRSQHDFQVLLDTIQGILWECDATTLDLMYVSRSAQEILGYPLKRWYENGFWMDHIHAADRERVATTLARAVKQAETSKASQRPKSDRNIELEFRMIAADRRNVWLHNKLTLLIDPKPRFFGVGVDITHRKLSEENLQLAHAQLEKRIEERTTQLRETVSQLEAFSYTLSHDMRAPLRSIHGFSEMLREALQDRLKPFERDLFERVLTSTNRLDRLIQDVLHYSHVSRTAVELRPVDLQKVVDSTIRDYPMLRERSRHIEIVRPLLPVVGHEAFLSQCFSNLLSNALKFVPPGKRPYVRVRTEPEAGQVKVWVEDKGIGIAPEDQKRVFSIFQRLHTSPNLYEGTGIGLAIVAKAVERMGGTLGVESIPGKGSQFWFQLPAAPEPQQTEG